ncbi:MAG: hypothetical protein IPN78_05925 [Candidatus Accumulibacter sp.]|nr:hypothetical protein [Candidatus Accumulibacter propinquus]
MSFTPAVSNKALTAILRATTRKLSYRNRTELSLADISRLHNPILRGWPAYYGRFYRSAMYPRLQALQQDVGGLGDEEVQTAQRTQDTGEQVSRTAFREEAVSLRALAEMHGRCVCLMGAL